MKLDSLGTEPFPHTETVLLKKKSSNIFSGVVFDTRHKLSNQLKLRRHQTVSPDLHPTSVTRPTLYRGRGMKMGVNTSKGCSEVDGVVMRVFGVMGRGVHVGHMWLL